MKKFFSVFLAGMVALSGTCFADNYDNQDKVVRMSDNRKLIYISHDNIAPLIRRLENIYGKHRQSLVGDNGKFGITLATGLTAGAALLPPTNILCQKVKNKNDWSAKAKIAAMSGLVSAYALAIPTAVLGSVGATFAYNNSVYNKMDRFHVIEKVQCYTRAIKKCQKLHNTNAISDEIATELEVHPRADHRRFIDLIEGLTDNGYGNRGFDKGLIKVLKQISPDLEHRATCGKFRDEEYVRYLPAYTDSGKGIVLLLSYPSPYSDCKRIEIFSQGDAMPDNMWTTDRCPQILENKSFILEGLPGEYVRLIDTPSTKYIGNDNDSTGKSIIDDLIDEIFE